MIEPDGQGVDPIVRRELREGEEVLWWGRPDPKKAIQPEGSWGRHRPVWLSLLLLGLLVVGLDVLTWLVWRRLFPSLHFSPALLLLVPAVAILLILLPGRSQKRGRGGDLTAHADLKHTTYAVTNQRILVIVDAKHVQVHSYTKNEIDTLDRVERHDGYGNVSFGYPLPASAGASPPPRASFVGIAGARAVEALLTKTFKEVGAAQGGQQEEERREGWGVGDAG